MSDFSLCVWCFINIKEIIHPRIKIGKCFIFLPSFTHSKVVLTFPSSAKHKRYFEECGKPNSCWSTVTSIVFLFLLSKLMWTSNCLVTHILQNIFLLMWMYVALYSILEGSDAAGFLRVNLSKWIPSLKGRNIEIYRAHRVYDGGRGSDRPRTLIFRVLRWHDRSEILKGARRAYPVKCTQDNVTLLFFPDFSPVTAAKRKSLVPVLRTMTALGLQPFLAYPAVIKLWHGGEQRSSDSLWKAEDFVSSLSQKAAAFSSARREGLGGRDGGDTGCPEEDGGRRDMDAC